MTSVWSGAGIVIEMGVRSRGGQSEVDRKFEIEEMGQTIKLAGWRGMKELATNTQIGIGSKVISCPGKEEDARSCQVDNRICLHDQERRH